MKFYKNKNILVTGGTGMIGIPLVKMLLEFGANVTIASLDDKKLAPKGSVFFKADLRDFKNCLKLCKNKDIVFHLAGVKGSPLMTKVKPASFFVPTLTFSLNMMEAARRCNVPKYLFTSSIGVYAPAKVFLEEHVWKTFPSPNDRFAGWAKRMCELQAEAYKIEYKWKNISIVRPANVYGPYDNFDIDNAMVIPSLIRKASESKKKMHVWGDGSPVRDFIFADDVARAMLIILKKGINEPINIGSGKGHTIKEIANFIAKKIKNGPLEIIFDTNKPSGDQKRLMNVDKLKRIGFKPKVNIRQGLLKTIEWYEKNKKEKFTKFNSFKEI
jgi:GDP-L-fucose synthase